MKLSFNFFILLLFVCISATGQETNQNLHPDIWLRADQLMNKTEYWQDVSGNNHHAVNGSVLPPVTLFNFNPSFYFDGSLSPFMIAYDMENLRRMTVIVAYKTMDSIAEHGIWSMEKDTLMSQNLTTQSIGCETFHIKYNNFNDTIGIINTYGFSWNKTIANSIPDSIFIAGTDNMTFKGKIAECLIYPDIIKDKNLQIIQSYLCLKYGVTLKDKNYINSKGTVLWNYKENIDYNNSIVGIGRDTTFNLNQKQSVSTSSQDILTIGAGLIDTTNFNNNYQFNDGDFLVCGNNRQNLNIKYLDSTMTIGILERLWLMQATGNTMTQVPVELRLDLSGILLDSMMCRLIISRITDSGVSLNNVEYLTPDSITPEKTVIFRNIHFDVDMSGKDIFSVFFMKILPLNASNQNNLNINLTSSPNLVPLELLVNNNTAQVNNMNQQISISSPAYYNNSFVIYPNPNNGSFEIEITLYKPSSLKIMIMDSQGKIIQSYTGAEQQKYRYTGSLTVKGTYYVDITVDNEHKIFPVIVQ